MPSNQNFEDIEMLDVPDEDSSSMSDAGLDTPLYSGASKGQIKSSSVNLKDWLDSSKNLEFKFDAPKYEQSLEPDEFSKHYAKYVTALYKSLERITKKFAENLDEDRDVEPIGLISSENDFSAAAMRAKESNNAFTHIIETLSTFLEDIEALEISKSQKEKFYLLLSILDCIKASFFYDDLKVRPELIAKWINRYDYKPAESLVEDIMFRTPKPYLHPQFWNTYLSQLITRGLFSQAVTAIMNSKYDELAEKEPATLYSVIADFKNLLENYTKMSLKDEFQDWKLLCCQFRDTILQFRSSLSDPKEVIILNQINELLNIMTGLYKTISSACDSWYEVYGALSFFQVRDDAALYDNYFSLAIKEKPPYVASNPDSMLEISEQCFLNVLEQNFLIVLSTMDRFDSATAAYVSRLLEFKGLLKNYYSGLEELSLKEILNKKTISEYLLTSHAFNCLNNHFLVPVGIGLLVNKNIFISEETSEHNKETIASFLPHFQCQTNDDLEWELTICAKLNLVSTARKLYLKYGRKSFKDGYLFEALNMFVRSCDPDDISINREGIKEAQKIIWDIIFMDSIINNGPIDDVLINNIVSNTVDPDFKLHPALRQCLAPYAVLCEFYESADSPSSGQVSEKLTKLIHLLRFKHLPKKFYPPLLCQILPFLIGRDFKFHLPDLIVIIELIDNYETDTLEEDIKESNEIIDYALESSVASKMNNDWRMLLRKRDVKDVRSLITYLRNEIVTKIGKVFIEQF